MDGQPEVIGDRAQALRTCPARAPDPFHRGRPAGPGDHLHQLVATAHAELDRLPEDQRGGLWVDVSGSRVVVQVTRDADLVAARLRQAVEDPGTVEVELVRYSAARLKRWAETITAMDDLPWTTVSWSGPNNRVEVGVRGPAEPAWRRIAAVVDPCAFRVSGNVDVVPLAPTTG